MCMKLYLSSYHLGKNSQKLVALVENNPKTAVVPNALDFATNIERRNASILAEINDLKKLGFQPEEFDLKKYFGNPKKLGMDLSKYGLIWVVGGNSFLLRKAMWMCGMDKWLIKSKKSNNIVYGGYSAGVCVLSPNLKGLELVDDPKVVAEGYDKKIIWDGIGIIDWAFAPHYKSNHPESAKVSKLVEFYIDKNIYFKALRDGEVIIEK